MSPISKIMSRTTAMKIVVYCAVVLWLPRMFETLVEPLPWRLILTHPVFIVHLVMGGFLFAALWRISED